MDFMNLTAALIALDLVTVAGLFLAGQKGLDDARAGLDGPARAPHGAVGWGLVKAPPRALPWAVRRRAYLWFAGAAVAAVPLVLPFV